MKKLSLFLILLATVQISFAQGWIPKLEEMKQEKKGNVTLHDMQKVFNDYWNEKGVVNGFYYENGEKVKAPGWKQFKRWEWYWEQNVNPATGEFPERSTPKEMLKYKKSSSKPLALGNWQPLGPTESDGGYAGLGRINAVAFHPGDNNTFWVGAPSGGLWETTDGGSTWTVLTDNNEAIGVSDIAVRNDYASSQTMYIATGDRDGGSLWSLGGGNSADNQSVGVLKSTNGGATWNTTGLSFVTSNKVLIGRLLMHPDDNDILYAGTNRGIYKTTDGGVNWTAIYEPTYSSGGSNYYYYIIDMEFKPGDPSTIYASTKKYGNPKIFRTTDDGSNWSEVKSFGSSDYRVEIAVTPHDANYLYALVANGSGAMSGLHLSTNSGDNFTLQLNGSDSGANLLGYENDGSGTRGQGGYDLCIDVSPTDKNTVLVGGINSWRSTDAGVNWTIVNHWVGDGADEVHADKHAMTYRSDGTLFEGNDGGIYISTDDGDNWTDLTNDMTISQIYRIGVSQTDATQTITGLQDNGSKLLYQGDWYDVTGGDGMECIIDYTDPSIQYATYVNGTIYRTEDYWENRTTISNNIGGSGHWVTPYIIHPTDPQILFVGYEDVYKTEDRGNNFTEISDINSSQKLRSMAISESNPDVLYVADQTNIYVTTNGGSNWDNISSGLPVSTNSITYIAVDAADPDRVWVTFGGYDAGRVYESVDGGSNWTNISDGLPNIPTYTIVQNKIVGGQNLYVGTDRGVYYKEEGLNWIPYDNGLPNVVITELEIFYGAGNTANSRLRAGTYGRGLWESELELAQNEAKIVEATPVDGNYCEAEGIVPTVIFENNGAASLTSLDVAYQIDSETPVVYNWTGDLAMGERDTVEFDFLLLPSGEHDFTYYLSEPNGVLDEDTSNDTIYYSYSAFNEAELPFTMDFAEELPSCWMNTDIPESGNEWSFGTNGSIALASTTAADGYAWIEGIMETESELITPTFNFSAYSIIGISFDHVAVVDAANLEFAYSTNGGDTWSTYNTWSSDVSNPTTYMQDISTEVAGKDSVVFKFMFSVASGGTAFWALDNINITGSLSGTPVVITEAATGIGYTKATLNGKVNPSVITISDIYFELGTETGVYDQSYTAVPSSATGNSNVPVTADITNIEKGMTYFYRLVASDGITDYAGVEKSFETPVYTIAIGEVAEGPFIINADIGAAVDVPYTIEGNYESGNKFMAYLSDASGSFDNEKVVGSLTSQSNGTVKATIPGGTASGTGYKLRVRSTKPDTVSAPSTAIEVVLDDTAPTVSITSDEDGETSENPIPVVITFSEEVIGFEKADITVTNGSVELFGDDSAPVYYADIVPTEEGTVTVTVNSGVAVDIANNGNTEDSWSITYAEESTGIDPLYSLGLSIYPNPSDGEFMLRSNNIIEKADITVMDLSGKEILKKSIRNEKEIVFDLSNEPKGAYILRVKSDKGEANVKVIVK